MSYKMYESKIAATKESKKLGKIFRVDMLPGKTIKKDIPYAMIHVQQIFKKDVLVPVEISKVLKIEGNYVWFDITESEFKEETKRIRKLIVDREMYTGDTGFHKVKGNLGFAYDPYRLSRKGKERRK